MDDRENRIRRVEAAIATLRERGHPDLTQASTSWNADACGSNQRNDAADLSAAQELVRKTADILRVSPAPIVIEGLSPPWLLHEIARATPPLETGYQPAIWVVQADEHEFFDGCAAADLAGLLAEPRIRVFVGPSAKQDFEAALAEPLRQPQAAIVLPTVRRRLEPKVGELIRLAVKRQAADHAARVARLAERDAQTTPAERRVSLARRDRPRRVALIAGRFTTVLKPMIDDLAGAFEDAGWQTRVLSEPSDHRQLVPASYSAALEEFDPDLVVAANHAREDMDRVLAGRVMPRGLPWVTWVQDSMPHLLGASSGSSIGELDLAIGHISSAMVRDCGYPAERVIAAPMVASERKFAPAESAPREETIHIAAFTNHSETPDAMRLRLIREAAATPGLAQIVTALADAAMSIADKPMHRTHALHACRDAAERIVPTTDRATIENLTQNVALRLVDRVLRHRTLGWGRSICDRRGWTMRIFGRGWESHPSLGHLAAGELRHGPELAAAYRAARLTLHASCIAPMHQRLLECALAGGLPAAAATHGSITLAQARIVTRLIAENREQAIPGGEHAGRRWLWFDSNRFPHAARRDALARLRGDDLPPRPAGLGTAFVPIPDADPSTAPTATPELDADKMLGLLELGYTDEPSLERLIERATDDDGWRSRESARIADRARATCTHTSLVRRIEGYYEALAEAPDPARAGTASSLPAAV
ncbi:MAG: hypothetical protein AAGF47_05960 [Planctomycetota bacterium]